VAAEGTAPLRIRGAEAADLPALVELEARAFTDPWNIADLGAELAAPGAVVLVLVDTSARLAGYATFRQLPDAWELLRLAVAPERRRAGLGRRLLREGLRRLGGAGERFCLEVREDNVAACQLYETEEFRRVGRRPGYYRDGTAALLYARESAQR